MQAPLPAAPSWPKASRALPCLPARLQAAVEDGLIHVDIALPDYKIAFFLEGAEKSGAGGGGKGAAGAMAGGLSALDPEGVVLSG